MRVHAGSLWTWLTSYCLYVLKLAKIYFARYITLLVADFGSLIYPRNFFLLFPRFVFVWRFSLNNRSCVKRYSIHGDDEALLYTHGLLCMISTFQLRSPISGLGWLRRRNSNITWFVANYTVWYRLIIVQRYETKLLLIWTTFMIKKRKRKKSVRFYSQNNGEFSSLFYEGSLWYSYRVFEPSIP